MKSFYILNLALIISSCVVLAEDKLIFLQSVWRHGDRSPKLTFPKDSNQEATWHQGFGQLSALGMKQHVRLGQTLRQRYIVNNLGGLNLSSSYASYEIYIRSSDVNRTIISAMSNMIGFYGAANVTAGLDYPDMPEWPGKFVPIAVHTVDYPYDYIGNTKSICPRRDQIWNLVKQTPEWQKVTQENQPMFDTLSNITGWNVTLDNISYLFSAIYIEKLSNLTNSSVYQEIYKYYDDINKTTDKYKSFYVGLDLAPYKGVDFSVEIPTLRGGSLLWAIIGQMRAKYDCYTKKNTNPNVCQHWMDPLKYYVWSFHDTTLASLSVTLGFNSSNYNEDGYPQYSSCVTFELWVKDDNSSYIRVYYLPLTNTSDHLLKELTYEITGCEHGCTLDQFEQRSQIFKPNGDGNIAAMCNTNLFNDTSNPTPPTKTTSSLSSN